MKRIVQFEPAFDKRDPDPKKNYGIHGVTLRMVLKGPLGAVQFVLYTNWQLPHVQKELEASQSAAVLYRPLPADIGYHSPFPVHEGQRPMGAVKVSFTDNPNPLERIQQSETGTFTPCEYLDGKPCYYDGSGLRAEKVFEVLLREGSDGVWKFLEAEYAAIFLSEKTAVAERQH